MKAPAFQLHAPPVQGPLELRPAPSSEPPPIFGEAEPPCGVGGTPEEQAAGRQSVLDSIAALEAARRKQA